MQQPSIASPALTDSTARCVAAPPHASSRNGDDQRFARQVGRVSAPDDERRGAYTSGCSAPRNTTSRLPLAETRANCADARLASSFQFGSSPRHSKPWTTATCCAAASVASTAAPTANPPSRTHRITHDMSGSLVGSSIPQSSHSRARSSSSHRVAGAAHFVVPFASRRNHDEQRHRAAVGEPEAAAAFAPITSAVSCGRSDCWTRATSTRPAPSTASALRAVEDDAIREVVRFQEDLGLRGITDGEFRRTYFHIDFLTKLVGRQDRGRHQRQLSQRHRQRRLRAAGDAGDARRCGTTSRSSAPTSQFLRSVTTRTPKVTIPSPTMLHFRGGRGAISRDAYPDLEAVLRRCRAGVSPTRSPSLAARRLHVPAARRHQPRVSVRRKDARRRAPARRRSERAAAALRASSSTRRSRSARRT